MRRKVVGLLAVLGLLVAGLVPATASADKPLKVCLSDEGPSDHGGGSGSLCVRLQP